MFLANLPKFMKLAKCNDHENLCPEDTIPMFVGCNFIVIFIPQ